MIDIETLVTQLVGSAVYLLQNLPAVFTYVFEIFYFDGAFTELGVVLVATAGFALAWAGIRLILGYIGKLLNATRGGRR